MPRVKAKTFSVPLTDSASIRETIAAVNVNQQSMESELVSFEDAAARRGNGLALALLGMPQVAKRVNDAATRSKEAFDALPVLAALRLSLTLMLELAIRVPRWQR